MVETTWSFSETDNLIAARRTSVATTFTHSTAEQHARQDIAKMVSNFELNTDAVASSDLC